MLWLLQISSSIFYTQHRFQIMGALRPGAESSSFNALIKKLMTISQCFNILLRFNRNIK